MAPAATPGAAPLDWERDARETAYAMRSWGPDRVVVDHYGLDARWHRRVSEVTGAPVAVVDDLGDRNLETDLLIDHNLADHASKYAAYLPSTARILGGPRFALLSPTYRAAQRKPFGERVGSIGIFMGGADPGGVSALALQACREQAGFVGAIEIATTSVNSTLDTLTESCRRWPPSELLIDSPDLISFHLRHDLHIGAGGGAAWERCCLGIPALLLRAAANQDAVIPALVERGVVATVALGSPDDVVCIGRAVAQLVADPERRMAMSLRGRELVDGAGALRVALVMAGSLLKVRPATMADSRMMHSWRNHPLTRRASLDDSAITWSSHVEWCQSTLANPDRMLLIGVVGNISVGVIRLDRAPGQQVEVSLYLDPTMHGLGLGAALLRAGELQFTQTCGEPTGGFVATVRENNRESQRLFTAAGYLRATNTRWHKSVSTSSDWSSR